MEGWSVRRLTGFSTIHATVANAAHISKHLLAIASPRAAASSDALTFALLNGVHGGDAYTIWYVPTGTAR